MWFEKYRPHAIEDIAISEYKIAELRKWFDDFQKGTQNGCALLFTGPPGLGKTTLAHVILREYGYKVKEFNASDTRSKTLIGECLDSLINCTDVSKIINKNEPPIGIIMDEVDGMFKGDRGGVQELLAYITQPSKRSKKENKNVGGGVPIICICNLGHVKKDTIKHLQKVCCEISFDLPEPEALKEVLQRVIEDNHIIVEPAGIDMIVNHSQKDFRRLLTFMEFLYSQNLDANITVDQIREGIDNFVVKERDLHITDSIKGLLNERLSSDEINNIYNGDKSKAPMVVHRNYLRAICLQDTTVVEKFNSVIATMDSIVVSDVIEKIMYNTQCWFLQPIQGYAATYVTNYYMNKHPKTMIVQSDWASVLSINSQSQNLRKNAHELMYNIHGYSIDDVQSLIEIVFQLFINNRYECAMKHIIHYKLCNLEEFKTKKAITVIDKIAKFIKLSKYYDRWAIFKETIKNDKTFEKRVQDAIANHNDGIRITKIPKSGLKFIQKPVIKVVPKKPILTQVEPTNLLNPESNVITTKSIAEQETLVNTRKTVIVKKKMKCI